MHIPSIKHPTLSIKYPRPAISCIRLVCLIMFVLFDSPTYYMMGSLRGAALSIASSMYRGEIDQQILAFFSK